MLMHAVARVERDFDFRYVSVDVEATRHTTSVRLDD